MEIQKNIIIPTSHPVFTQHFPGQPLVPAALLLAWLQKYLAEEGIYFGGIHACKFYLPTLPGDHLKLMVQEGKSKRLLVKLLREDQLVFEAQLLTGGANVE
jgi:3-hydroxymyristoyl/3-hydroxydecanoyl-(acyl carrier protein) dehydratase